MAAVALALHIPTAMSRLAGFVLVLFGSVALADSTEAPPTTDAPVEKAPKAGVAKASKFPLRVVKILSDSEQALLFDQKRGRHVLVEVGDSIGDYTIQAITEEEVTIAGKELPVEIALPSPEARVVAAKPAAKKPAADAVAPEDPYADKAPADPYADEGEGDEEPVRAVTWGAPTTEPAMPVDTTMADDAPPTPKAGPKGVARGEGEKTTVSPLAHAEPPKPSEDVAKRGSMSKADEAAVLADAMVAATAAPAAGKLSKKEVQAALADFGALAASIDASFVATGLEIKQVKAGSVFAKAGLASGDIVTAVDGKPLRTLDDAADLYARAGAMKSANVQVMRAGKPQTLRVTIQ